MHINDIHEIPKQLYKMRSDRGLSLRHVAAHADVDTGSLQLWEKGAIPKVDSLSKLLNFYGESMTFGADPEAKS